MRPSMRDTPAEVEPILRSLPARLRPERLGGYAGVFHFDIPGAASPRWTITIEDGACRVDEGHRGEPTCTITMDETTFLSIETGKQNPVMAFVKGKIKVTNVGQMRKYDRAFFRFYDVPEA
jgi:SCP-2 sterol transfer family